MNPFSVWIGSFADSFHVRVDGIRNAQWLLARLSRDFVFKTIKPIREETGSPCCHFDVAYNPRLSPAKFERLLSSIPPVRLLMESTDETGSSAPQEPHCRVGA